MLAIEIRFLAGRYHATPWARHVNESAVDWPPEPWRMLRALIATWHHKVQISGRYQESTLSDLIEALAEQSPDYALPAASHSHTRHYMPPHRLKNSSLIFDGFVAVSRDTPLIVRWPDLELPYKQTQLLDDLLGVMGYLGRAESWIEARRLISQDDLPAINCQPGTDPIDHETGAILGEVVSLNSPVAASKYAERRSAFREDSQKARKLDATLPERLLGALSLDTADLQKQGWSAPPASQQVHYVRLRPKRISKTWQLPATKATTARFILLGKPLPRVEDTLRIGELMRLTVMSAFKKDDAGKRLAPWHISGHDLPDGKVHQHAFYLPFDSNGDGRLDRIMLHVPHGFGDAEQVIAQFSRQRKRLWDRNGGEWRLLFEGIGDVEIGGVLTKPSDHWISVTPYLHPWYRKKNLGIEDQIRRECRLLGLPEISELTPKENVSVGNGRRHPRPIHFRRFRSLRRGAQAHQPDRRGSFWKIHFIKPVLGPLALGFGCHYGLGLFRPK